MAFILSININDMTATSISHHLRKIQIYSPKHRFNLTFCNDINVYANILKCSIMHEIKVHTQNASKAFEVLKSIL